MAMNETAMAALCKANIEAITNYPAPGMSPIFVDDRILIAICKGVIDHIKAAMSVASQGADPQGGVVSSTSTSVT